MKKRIVLEMKKAKSLVIFSLCLALCAGLFACNSRADNSAADSESQSSNTHDGGVYTAFSAEEEAWFFSSFGFVIPFIQNTGYKVEEYEGYNGDLLAYENGLSFYAEVATQEACEDYVEALKDDENYSFEYPQDSFYYFTRDGYFVKVAYYWLKTNYGLEVYTYRYTFENIESSNPTTDSSASASDSDGEDEPIPQTGFKYEKNGNDSYSIIGFYGDEDGVVEIPDTYNGLPVRDIRGNAFYNQEVITEVIVGDNVYSIEGNAFMHCHNLQKVTLGSSLQLIDMQAFLGCYELEEITVPASVTFIGHGAFKGCDKLKSVVLEDPAGWCTSDDLYNRPFPVEDMSNARTVAEYFKDTYTRVSWIKEW